MDLSHTDTGTGKEHVSRAKDPAIVQKGRKIIEVIKTIFWLCAMALVIWIIISWISTRKEKAEAARVAKEEAAKAAAIARANVEFPTSGEGHATKEVGLKAWLDPMKTYTRASKPARYVFVKDTDLFFDITESARVQNTEHYKEWLNMPPGEYIVYPLKGEKIYFRWWQ